MDLAVRVYDSVSLTAQKLGSTPRRTLDLEYATTFALPLPVARRRKFAMLPAR